MKFDDLLLNNKNNTGDIIYNINKVIDKKSYIEIVLDNKEKIKLDIEDYFNMNLPTRKGLDLKTYNLLKEKEIILCAYLSCLNRLSKKDYTLKQISNYLKNTKKIDDIYIKDIILKLENLNLIDDKKYCINRYQYLDKLNYSNKQIKYKLLNEGVDIKIIQDCINIDNDNEYNKVVYLVNKYSKSIKNKSNKQIKNSILTKLLNNGFDYEMCKEVVNKLDINNEDEIKYLEKDFNKIYSKYLKKYENYELRNHIYAYLLNKGYKSSDIKKIMEENNV